MFGDLFLESPENTELLNRTASAFFAWTQQALLDDLILSLSRMLDRPKTGQQNLVLSRLLDALPSDVRTKIGSTLESSLESARSTESSLRHHRDKRIAHQDWNILLSIDGAQLKPTTCGEIRRTLEHIEAFLGTIYRHFTDSTPMWDMPDIHGGSDSLLSCLRMAEAYQQLRRS
jgi:AbiU2